MKYFYTDARIAELMEEWHYIWNSHDIKTYPFPPDENTDGRSLLSVDSDIKWYTHPSCHELLKPQVGDIVKTIYTLSGRPSVFIITGFHKWLAEDGSEPEVAILHTGDTCGLGTIEIIQRNGKAFFMPEQENNAEGE